MDGDGNTDRRIRSSWSDVGLTAAAAALSASIALTLPEDGWSPGPAAWLLVATHVVPVAFRRQWPRAGFAVSMGAGALYVALGWPMVVLGLAGLVMTYSLAAYGDRPSSVAGLIGVELALIGAVVLGAAEQQPDTLLGNVLILAAAWLLGDGTRRRREAAVSEQHRLARQAVADERLRIARELHDIVAHSMSVIAVQAGTGRVVLEDDPEQARRALSSIEATSRQALDEMRRLLGVLRTDSDPTALAPVPRLDDLEQLVAAAVDGGTPVEVVVEGERRAAPAGIEVTAYRVLQEALTNVRRHAPGAPAHVRVFFGPEELVIEVDNRVPDGSPPARPGHGLLGMRERVSFYGGTFDAAPGPDRTFRVRARLPFGTAGR